VNHEADLAEYLVAQRKRELKRHPRCPVILSRRTSRDIEASAILEMTVDRINELLREFETRAA